MAIGGYNGAKLFDGKVLGYCAAPASSLLTLYLLWNFLADLNQYRRANWNLEQRRPRLTFYPGEEPPGPTIPPLSPVATMFFAYPGFIVGAGGVAAFSWANILGYLTQ